MSCSGQMESSLSMQLMACSAISGSACASFLIVRPLIVMTCSMKQLAVWAQPTGCGLSNGLPYWFDTVGGQTR